MSIFPYSTTYDLNNLIPQDWRTWDDYWTRLNRYEIFAGYYHNIAYHSIVTYSQALKVQERLYKHVRGVYNPVKRLNESYVSKVFSGMLDIENGTTGAIPLQSDNLALIQAIIRLWIDSRWSQKKSLFVRNGAMKGDSFIKIVDDIHNRQVRMEALDPAKVKKIRTDSAGKIEYAELEYYIKGHDDRAVKYTEKIDKDMFKVELDGKPDSHHLNGRNELVSEWNNDYGFVPLTQVQHMDMGLAFGAPAIYGSMHKINELNDLASILNDGMRKQVQLPLIFKNAAVGTVDLGSDQSSQTQQRDDLPRKDTIPALSLTGENADVMTLPPTIDIAAGLENIINVTGELEKDLPELALHRLRDSGQLTAPGVRSAYDDAISRYQESRGNYDGGTIEAHKMGVAIGGLRGYDGYQGFNLISLENGSLDHQIAQRPVINDSLSLSEQLERTLAGMSQNAPKIFYIKAGWSDSEADEFVESAESSRNSSLLNNPFAQQTETPALDDTEATPQDVFDIRQNGAVNETDILGATALLETA